MKNTSTVLFGVALTILLMFTFSFAAEQPKSAVSGTTTNVFTITALAPQLTELQTKNIIIAYQNAVIKSAPKDAADAAFQEAVNNYTAVRDENLKSAGFAAGSDVKVNLVTGVVTVTPPPAPPTPSTPPAPTAAPVTGPAVPTTNRPAEKK